MTLTAKGPGAPVPLWVRFGFFLVESSLQGFYEGSMRALGYKGCTHVVLHSTIEYLYRKPV